MRRFIKNTVESLSGQSVWMDKPSSRAELLELIRELRPRLTKRPLVRVGGVSDGGYLLPDDLDGIEFCISPGTSTEVSFDDAMAARGIPVYMADASVDGPPHDHPLFHFSKKFVGVVDDDLTMRIDTLMESATQKHAGDGILQMDIESAEYRTLLDASDDALRRLRIIVIEFHRLDNLFGRMGFDLIGSTFRKLLRYHEVIHIHPNNVAAPSEKNDISIPPVCEFTFVRRDRQVTTEEYANIFPHPLDQPNIKDYPSFALSKVWYSTP